MSSVQDRIRRLQSADAPPPSAPPVGAVEAAKKNLANPSTTASVSSLATQFASAAVTEETSTGSVVARAAAVEQISEHGRAVGVEKRAAAFAAEKVETSASKLAARITQLEAGVGQDSIARQVKRLETEKEASKLGVRGAGNDGVAGVRGAFEKDGKSDETSNAVRARAGAFERKGVEGEAKDADIESIDNKAKGLLNRVAAFDRGNDDGTNDGLKPAVMGRAAVFEGGREEKRDDETASKPAVLGRAAVFEQKREDNKEEKEALTKSSISGKAVAFERPTDRETKKGVPEPSVGSKQVATEPKEARTPRGVLDRAGIFERGVGNTGTSEAKDSNADNENKSTDENQTGLRTPKTPSALSSRFAMFESKTQESALPKKSPPTSKPTPNAEVPEATLEKPVAKTPETNVEEMGKPNSALEELREVKALNKELVARLVELTGAFKRLEKTREDLQARITKLEQK